MTITSKYFLFTIEQKTDILKKFGRTVESLKEDVEAIKLWLEKQPHLPKCSDDRYIEHYLVAHKFIFNEAKKSINGYYQIKNSYPKYFTDPDLKDLEIVLNQVFLMPLPKMTPSNNRVIVWKLKNKSVHPNFDLTLLMRYTRSVADLFVNFDCACAKEVVLDFKDLSIEFITLLTSPELRTAQIIGRKAYHNSMHRIHFLNVNSKVAMFINFIKSIANPKVVNRMHFHKNLSSLYEFIPQDILPKDYEGNEASLEKLQELWKAEIIEKIPWSQQHQLLVADESLRSEEAPDSDLLGINGNFRKLNLD